MVEHGFDLHAPHLLDVEVVSALRQVVAAGDASSVRAGEAVADLLDLPIERYAHEGLVPRVWELRENFSAYTDRPSAGEPDHHANDPGHHAEIVDATCSQYGTATPPTVIVSSANQNQLNAPPDEPDEPPLGSEELTMRTAPPVPAPILGPSA